MTGSLFCMVVSSWLNNTHQAAEEKCVSLPTESQQETGRTRGCIYRQKAGPRLGVCVCVCCVWGDFISSVNIYFTDSDFSTQKAENSMLSPSIIPHSLESQSKLWDQSLKQSIIKRFFFNWHWCDGHFGSCAAKSLPYTPYLFRLNWLHWKWT